MKKIKISLCLFSLLSLFSCKKYLETNPDMRTEINSVDKLAQLVGTAYPSYPYLAMAEMYSDNVLDKGPDVASTHISNPYPEMYRWEDVQETGNNTPTQYWNGAYAGIAAANQALEAVEKYNMGDGANPYKGEALVARAYAHFMLVTFFAKPYEPKGANNSPGIPYVLKPETTPIQTYERGTVASVYAQIEKDLTDGIALLAGGRWDVPKYHFTPAAAHAFATRFYLFKGEWQKVIDHANKIFPGGDFAGNLRDYVGVITTLGTTDYNNYFTKADKKFNLLLREMYSVFQRSNSFPQSRYGFSQQVFNNYYAAAAPNPVNTVLSTDPTVNETTLPNGTRGRFVIPSNGNFISRSLTFGTGNFTTYVFREHFHYTNVTAGIGYPYIMQPLFIADEALANRAEAYAQLDRLNDAIQDLNTFARIRIPTARFGDGVTIQKSKDFFGVVDNKDAIIKTALHFKRVGFMGEGMRWFDILRHKIVVKHNFIDANKDETFEELGADDPRRAFQIPQEAVTLGGLQPNPR